MYVRPNLHIYIADPVEVFGMVTAPDGSYGDWMADAVKRGGAQLSGVRYDEALDCLMLAPRYDPADTLIAGATTAGGTWKEIVSRVSGKKTVSQTAPALNTEWSYSYGSSVDVAIEEGEGLWIVLTRSAPRPNATRSAANVYVRARLMVTAELGYRISWAFGESPRLERTEDGATWTRVGDIPVADGGKMGTGDTATLRFQVLRAGGAIAFRATPTNSLSESALVIPDCDLRFPLYVTGKNLMTSIAHFPVQFDGGGTFESADHQSLWFNTSIPVPTAYGSAAGVTAAMVATGSDYLTRYRLTLGAAGTLTVTPWVRRAKVTIPLQYIAPAANPAWVELAGTLGYELVQEFLPAVPTVRRGGAVHCRNQSTVYPSNGYGPYSAANGMVAVWIVAAMEAVAPDGTFTTIWSGTRFVGWMNIEQVATTYPPARWTSWLADPIEYELMVPLLQDIQLDGDCYYHAMRTLAERAGVVPERLMNPALMPGAPADAWTCDGVTCIGTPGHFAIGAGLTGSPMYEFTADQLVWQAMATLAGDYRMFVGVSSNGYFETFPWAPEGARTAWAPKQIFTAVPAFTAGVPQLNELLGELVRHTSLRDVRNSVTLAGLNQETWEPCVAHRFDAASVFGTGYGTAPPVNYMGRVRAFAETNKRFSIPELTDYVCARYYNAYRQPQVWYDPLSCWLQPLFPLDYVGVAANRAFPYDEAFYIEQTSEWVSVVEGAAGAEAVESDMRLRLALVPYDLALAATDFEQANATNNAVVAGRPESYAIADQTIEGSGIAG